MKSCPFCAEKIQEAAIKCRYCGEWLEEPPTDRYVEPTTSLSKIEEELIKRVSVVNEEEAPFLLKAIEKYFDQNTPSINIEGLNQLQRATLRLQRIEPKALNAVFSIFRL